MSSRRIVRESDLEAPFPPLALELRLAGRWLGGLLVVASMVAIWAGAASGRLAFGWVPAVAAVAYAVAGPLVFLSRVARIRQSGVWQDWYAIPSAPRFLALEFARDFLNEWNVRWMLMWLAALPLLAWIVGHFFAAFFIGIAVVGNAMAAHSFLFSMAISLCIADDSAAAADVRDDLRSTDRLFLRWSGWDDWWQRSQPAGGAVPMILVGFLGGATVYGVVVVAGLALLWAGLWSGSGLVLLGAVLAIVAMGYGASFAHGILLRSLDAAVRRLRP